MKIISIFSKHGICFFGDCPEEYLFLFTRAIAHRLNWRSVISYSSISTHENNNISGIVTSAGRRQDDRAFTSRYGLPHLALSHVRVSAVRCAPSRVETQLSSGDGSRD